MTEHDQDQVNAGSSASDEPFFVVVGKLRKPHGVRGEMVMTVATDFPELLSPGQEVYVGENHRPLTVRSTRWHRDDILIAFEEYHDRDEVGIYRNHLLFMLADDLPDLPDDEIYFYEVVGLKVITDTGQELGEVRDVLITGANEVYLVGREGEKDILLPATEEVILNILPEEGVMKVRLLPGLLED